MYQRAVSESYPNSLDGDSNPVDNGVKRTFPKKLYCCALLFLIIVSINCIDLIRHSDLVARTPLNNFVLSGSAKKNDDEKNSEVIAKVAFRHGTRPLGPLLDIAKKEDVEKSVSANEGKTDDKEDVKKSVSVNEGKTDEKEDVEEFSEIEETDEEEDVKKSVSVNEGKTDEEEDVKKSVSVNEEKQHHHCVPQSMKSFTTWPKSWVETYTVSELDSFAKDEEILRGQRLIKDMMKYTWSNYWDHAKGADGINPVLGEPVKQQGDIQITLLDSLSTLWIMGMKNEFKNATEQVRQLHFKNGQSVSNFEVTIRGVGGLLSAYALSCEDIFKEKAVELVDSLWSNFKYPLPANRIQLGKEQTNYQSGTALAEVGTFQMEFQYLSEITGDPKYEEKAQESYVVLLHVLGGKNHMLNQYLMSPQKSARAFSKNYIPNKGIHNAHYGGGSDSYYEYLLKLWLLRGQQQNDDILREAYVNSIVDGQSRNLFRKVNDPELLLAANSSYSTSMEHLACFMGGLLMLGDKYNASTKEVGHFEMGRKITNACHKMYTSTKLGLGPEEANYRQQKFIPAGGKSFYILRPEVAESIYYAYYFTGNPIYQTWALQIVDSIEKNCKTKFGYRPIQDVQYGFPSDDDESVQESFFLAETIKYLFLTLSTNPQDIINLDNYVFNTEAHPLLRKKKEDNHNNNDKYLVKVWERLKNRRWI